MTLRISARTLLEAKAHAEESYPEECCGLLASKDSCVVSSLRLRNNHSGPKGDRFSIDPLQLGLEDRRLRNRGLVVTGIYHSHPDSPAVLSRFDLDHSFPWYSYVVISVEKGRTAGVRAWRSEDGVTPHEEAVQEVA